jgi:predicted enzyme related to lactoylglutathione lyase
VRWFALGDQQLHLMPADANDGHIRRHFCIRVTDAAAARSDCEARGLEIQEEVEIPGIVRFFIFDPCGNRIELAQFT